ncbi:wall-associated receptor kinase 3 isoform X1 [Triticum aestivum]|nr:wall-associated receptor kinase 3-like isoform X1 [Triticum aestivum]
MPNCVISCGDVEVPYPFGIGANTSCYLPGFNLTCDNTTGSSPRLLLDADGTIQVLGIMNLDSGGYMYVQRNGDVKIKVDANGNGNGTFSQGLKHDGPYMLLTVLLPFRSELILMGCNVQATVKSGNATVASCTSLCDDTADYETSVIDRCSGGSTGCCRANIIKPGYDDDGRGEVYSSSSTAYDVQLRRLGRWNRSADRDRFPVRVFIAERGWFDNTSVSNDLLQTGRPPSKETLKVPVWLSWEVVDHPNRSSVCKSNHSQRGNGRKRGGYACACKNGYEGNPYLTDGCKDIDECEWSPALTGCYGECINTEGSFMCGCPPGTTGNFTIPGGCINTEDICRTSCGDVEVPYPFGIGSSKCYWPGFRLECYTGYQPPRLLLSNGRFQVVGISLHNSTMRVIRIDNLRPYTTLPTSMATDLGEEFPYFPDDEEVPYSLSTSNELVVTGCNAHATLVGHNNPAIISGCATFCYYNDTGGVWGEGSSTNGIHGENDGDKYCYGKGCCKARISESVDGMPKKLVFKWLDATSNSQSVFVFIAEEGWFDPWGVTGKLMRGGYRADAMKVPILLRWEVFLPHSGSSSANVSSHPDCNGGDYQVTPRDQICKSKHSQCKRGNRGYTCQCNEDGGYHGNPYLVGGCKDERAEYLKGLSITMGVASGAGLILVVLIAYFISYKFKHQRAQMLKRKYFEKNRGQLLQQLVSQRADIAEKMIITLEELEKATNNFDKARELGGGGHGTVYKGILLDLHVVAIKKPKMIVQREIDEFINEVAILSQINHRNVVKLYGCCLETEVPLLVYEFISNGTLYDHLHVEGPTSLSWADRLRIATETAKSLAHLHSTALVPIIHRDVKPANILLDDTLTAKVADFGASRYIPLDKSGLTTNVQGTLGYLDPMYMHTWRLTEKSDVYSFGVMLIELMTRKKPFTYMAPEGNGLVAHFAILFARGHLVEILDPQVLSEGGNRIDEIAAIAVACVKLRGEERPTMRQVELRLEVAQSPEEFEVDEDIAENSQLARGAGLTSRQYSMEEEYVLSARYPR